MFSDYLLEKDEEQYQQLMTDVNTTTVSCTNPDAIIVPLYHNALSLSGTGWSCPVDQAFGEYRVFTTGSLTAYSYQASQNAATLQFSGFKKDGSIYCTFLYLYAHISGLPNAVLLNPGSSPFGSSASIRYYPQSTDTTGSSYPFTISFSAKVLPAGGLSNYTSVNTSSANRWGGYVIPSLSDGENLYSDVKIVNEEDLTIYNPVTEESTTYVDSNYDFENREYQFILEDGSNSSLTYGDNEITLVEGDQTYIFYYMIDNPDSGSSDDPSESDGEGWSWWKTEWANFRSWLEQHMNNSGDSTIIENLPGETEEDEGWSLFSLTSEIVKALWKLGGGVVKVTIGGVSAFVSTVTDGAAFFDPYTGSDQGDIFAMFDEGSEANVV